LGKVMLLDAKNHGTRQTRVVLERVSVLRSLHFCVKDKRLPVSYILISTDEPVEFGKANPEFET